MSKTQKRLDVARLDTVADVPITWMWPGYMALQRTHINDGDPGASKSSTEFDIGARVTRGGDWPDGTPNMHGPGVVIVLSAEDNAADTIKPRFVAAGADVTRVYVIRASHVAGEEESFLVTIPDDVELIRREVEKAKAQHGCTYAFVIVDPVVAYLGGDTDTFRDQDVRRAMSAIERMCEETNSVASCIRHFKKGAESKMMHQGGGSVGFVGAARLVWATVFDPTDTTDDRNLQRRLIVPIKSNLGSLAPSLAFKPKTFTYNNARGQEITTLKIEWLGPSDVTVATLEEANAKEPNWTSKAELASHLVDALLFQGPLAASVVETRVRGTGISKRTLERVAKPPRVFKRRFGSAKAGTQEWWWARTEEELDRIHVNADGGVNVGPKTPVPIHNLDGGLKEEDQLQQGVSTGFETANPVSDDAHRGPSVVDTANSTTPPWAELLRCAGRSLPVVSADGCTDLQAPFPLSDDPDQFDEQALWNELQEAVGGWLGAEGVNK